MQYTCLYVLSLLQKDMRRIQTKTGMKIQKHILSCVIWQHTAPAPGHCTLPCGGNLTDWKSQQNIANVAGSGLR